MCFPCCHSSVFCHLRCTCSIGCPLSLPHLFSSSFHFLDHHLYIICLFLLFSTPTGVETPDVIDLRKQQRKEPEKPLYQVCINLCLTQFFLLLLLKHDKFSFFLEGAWRERRKDCSGNLAPTISHVCFFSFPLLYLNVLFICSCNWLVNVYDSIACGSHLSFLSFLHPQWTMPKKLFFFQVCD